jgi:hypothetical protein
MIIIRDVNFCFKFIVGKYLSILGNNIFFIKVWLQHYNLLKYHRTIDSQLSPINKYGI